MATLRHLWCYALVSENTVRFYGKILKNDNAGFRIKLYFLFTDTNNYEKNQLRYDGVLGKP